MAQQGVNAGTTNALNQSSTAKDAATAGAAAPQQQQAGPLGTAERLFSSLDPAAPQVTTFIEASNAVARIYEAFFGGASGTVSRILTQDLVNHTNQVVALQKLHPQTGMLLDLAKEDIDTRGADVVRKDRSATGGARGLLWLNRAMQFLAQFMALLAQQDKAQTPPNELAKEAYDRTLKAHHGWALSNVVRLALGTVPSRDQLLRAFGLASEGEATDALQRTTASMTPVLSSIQQFYERNGWDWPEKAGF